MIKSPKRHFGTDGTDLGRLGTAVGTDKTCKIPNVYRPWDGGTDKMGGRRHKLQKPNISLRWETSAREARLLVPGASRENDDEDDMNTALNRAKPGYESADKVTYSFCKTFCRLVGISKILTCLRIRRRFEVKKSQCPPAGSCHQYW